MDTSGSFQTFFNNASKLGLNLAAVEAILISHWHGDHCGALSQVLSLLKPQTPVYVPSENSFGIREIRRTGGIPVVCREPIEFVDGVMSTGEVPGGLSEHSLLANVDFPEAFGPSRACISAFLIFRLTPFRIFFSCTFTEKFFIFI